MALARDRDRQPDKSVVLLTGCSSGIGRAICDRLASSGGTVYGGSRTACDTRGWTYLPLDVTDESSSNAVVAEVLRREARLDALIACAGVGLAGPVEETADDEAKRQFDTNFFGTARMIRAVLPTMRKHSSGRIIVIGSIGGLIGLPFVPYYSASKFALDGLVEALRGEIAPFGIQATIVHPGDFNTAFGANRVRCRNTGNGSPYEPRFRDTLGFYVAQENNAPPPDALARKVEKLLLKRSLPARVIVGTRLEKLGVTAKRYLPSRGFEYLLRKSYAP